VRKLKL